jgi:hypothetical protein
LNQNSFEQLKSSSISLQQNTDPKTCKNKSSNPVKAA